MTCNCMQPLSNHKLFTFNTALFRHPNYQNRTSFTRKREEIINMQKAGSQVLLSARLLQLKFFRLIANCYILWHYAVTDGI